MSESSPPSERTTVRRGAMRSEYGRTEILAIIDAAPICHVGVSTEDGPLVLPMAHGRDDQDLFLHGAAANGLLRSGRGAEVCATFTLLDGLVLARTAFHNSMNYRSVVVRGVATLLEGDRKVTALRAISDHVVGTWDQGRPPNDSELRRTAVVAVPLLEMSAKVRTGDPVDEPEDMSGPWWSGTVPLDHRWGGPIPATDLSPGIATPEMFAALAGRGLL